MSNKEIDDFVVLFPAVMLGLPNAVTTNKKLLETHSKYFKKLFARKPDVDAYIVRTGITREDVQAIIHYMNSPSSVDDWPKDVLTARYHIARKLGMTLLCETISTRRRLFEESDAPCTLRNVHIASPKDYAVIR